MAVLIVGAYKWNNVTKDFDYIGKRTVNTNNIDHMYQDNDYGTIFNILFDSGSTIGVSYEDFEKIAEAMNS